MTCQKAAPPSPEKEIFPPIAVSPQRWDAGGEVRIRTLCGLRLNESGCRGNYD